MEPTSPLRMNFCEEQKSEAAMEDGRFEYEVMGKNWEWLAHRSCQKIEWGKNADHTYASFVFMAMNGFA